MPVPFLPDSRSEWVYFFWYVRPEYDNIPSLTVRKLKNRCIPCTYWVTAIFVVVAKYSNLFFPFTFFLNCPHLTFSYELIVRSEATDLMKIIRDSFPFV